MFDRNLFHLQQSLCWQWLVVRFVHWLVVPVATSHSTSPSAWSRFPFIEGIHVWISTAVIAGGELWWNDDMLSGLQGSSSGDRRYMVIDVVISGIRVVMIVERGEERVWTRQASSLRGERISITIVIGRWTLQRRNHHIPCILRKLEFRNLDTSIVIVIIGEGRSSDRGGGGSIGIGRFRLVAVIIAIIAIVVIVRDSDGQGESCLHIVVQARHVIVLFAAIRWGRRLLDHRLSLQSRLLDDLRGLQVRCSGSFVHSRVVVIAIVVGVLSECVVAGIRVVLDLR